LRYQLLIEEEQDRIARLAIRNPISQDKLLIHQSCLAAANKEWRDSQDELTAMYYKLVTNIVGYSKFKLIDPQDSIQDTVMLLLDKTIKFDVSKGKAFNYLSTVVLNNLRQLFRSAKHFVETKRKFADHLASKEPSSFRRPGHISYDR